jgi:hypothetical protein
MEHVRRGKSLRPRDVADTSTEWNAGKRAFVGGSHFSAPRGKERSVSAICQNHVVIVGVCVEGLCTIRESIIILFLPIRYQ